MLVMLVALTMLVPVMKPALATAIYQPPYCDYTLMGGSTSVNAPSDNYEYLNAGVICDTFRVARGVLRDTGSTGDVFYDPKIWPLTGTHALTLNLPAGLSTTGTQAYPVADSYAVQLPGKWSKFDVTKASADTGAATTYVVVGRAGPPITFTRPR
jgi:hypothetical protein